MNKEELIKRLKYIKETSGDTEADHIHVDKALTDFINDKEVTEAFNDIDKWYA